MRRLLKSPMSHGREVITPGVTTLGDVGWWVAEQKHKLGERTEPISAPPRQA